MFDKLLKILENRNVFLSGGAGVGKSYLTNEIKKYYKNKGKKVASLGSTAISAFNIGGITLHSFFSLGICSNLDELIQKDKKQKERLKRLSKIIQELDLLIIDEISMVGANIFDLITFRLKKFGFSGKILLVGDFFQLPPISKNTQQKHLFSQNEYAFSSLSWGELEFKNLLLNSSRRTKNAEFYEKLSLLRSAKLDRENLAYFKQFLISSKKDFENLEDDFTLLCGINKKVEDINKTKLNKLSGTIIELKANVVKIDESLDDNALQGWIKGLNVLEELHVKIGAKVIFCVNNWEANYYNGEQGVVEDIYKDGEDFFIEIRKSSGILITLEPYIFTLEDLSLQDEKNNILAKFIQFPIKLAYAITIHKSQGMSIDKLICDIDHIFESGQLYVALSRAIEPKNLKIFYSKSQNFEDYFANVLKVNENVFEFYKKTHFINLEDL